MKLKVFDFVCTKCGHVMKNVTIDESTDTTFVDDIHLLDLTCPLCGAVVEKSGLMVPTKHVSWSSWRIGHGDK